MTQSWHGTIAVEGVETGDNRMIKHMEFTHPFVKLRRIGDESSPTEDLGTVEKVFIARDGHVVASGTWTGEHVEPGTRFNVGVAIQVDPDHDITYTWDELPERVEDVTSVAPTSVTFERCVLIDLVIQDRSLWPGVFIEIVD